MCLAVPALLVERIDEEQAIVDLGGIRKQVSVALVADARVGDYVIVHVGHAIGMLDPEEAQRTLAMFGRIEAMAGEMASGMAGGMAGAQADAAADAMTDAPERAR